MNPIDANPPADKPLNTVPLNEAAYLKIVTVNTAGAFLDWGQPKDLLLPWAEVLWEQKKQIVEGRKVLVFIFKAEDGRMAASTRLNDFLRDEADVFQEGEEVEILVSHATDIGMRVIVDHRYWGLIHNNDIFGQLRRGEKRKAYIKALREDHKLNLSLSKPGYEKVESVAEKILKTLKKRGGFMPLTDKSQPELIYDAFGISKKVFKQSISALYRERKITLEADGIRLVPRSENIPTETKD